MTHRHDRTALISAREEAVAPAEDVFAHVTAPDEPVRSACSPQSVAPLTAAGFVQEPFRMARGIILALMLSAALWVVIALAVWLLLRG